MRRISTAVLGAVFASAAFVTVFSAGASAAPSVCGKSKSGGDMNMGHDMGNMDMNKSATKGSMGGSCPTVAGAREIAITGGAYAFTPNAITLAAGEDVTIALTADDIAHDFYVKGIGHIAHAKAGKTAMGGLRIDEAGTYKFWCTVAGHKKAGMTGVITVT